MWFGGFGLGIMVSGWVFGGSGLGVWLVGCTYTYLLKIYSFDSL